MKKLQIIDLFCGCGWLSFWFEKAGFEILLGIDHWNESLKTFEANHKNSKVHEWDLSEIKPKDISAQYWIKSVDLIIWGPPCQGFSISGKRKSDDPRNYLYKNFVNFVSFFKPKAFLLENVPNLVAMEWGLIKDRIIEDFSSLGYTVTYKILLASDYWVPQNRRRVFFVWLLNWMKFDFPENVDESKAKICAEEAISDLPEYSVNDWTPYISHPLSSYQEKMRFGSKWVFNHQVTEHSEQTKRIISLVPDGGNYKNLPEEYRDTRKVNIAWTRLNSRKPSFTIDTGHNHHFHYKYNRVPTARESARIQSFPDGFIFLWKKNDQLKQIGNAVPPILWQIIAEKLINYL